MENNNSFKGTNDKAFKKSLNDTRKPQITLRALNRLRKIRELEKFEKIKQKQFLEIMYSGKE